MKNGEPKKMLNRRTDARNSDNSLSIEIKDGIIGNESIVVPVSCVSDTGLSFYIPTNKFNLREEDVLTNIRLFNNDYDKFIEKAQIVYCTKIELDDVESKWKVGINFVIDEDNFNTREKRFEFKNYENHKTTFSINNIIFSNGKLDNISKYGISVVLNNNSDKTNLILSKGLIIKNIILEFKNQKFEIGDGTIVDIEYINNQFILRISLSSQFVLLDSFLELTNEKKVNFVVNKLEENIHLKNKVNLDFKENVFEYIYVLNNLKDTLDKFEKEIKYKEPKTKYRNSLEILEAVNISMKPKIDSILKKFDDISKDFSPEIYQIHAKYYKQNLHNLLLNAPINRTAYYKPLGNIWDYSLMEYLHNSDYIGSSLFNKFLHKYTTEIPVLVSYKNSFNYLYRKLKEEITNKLKDKEIIKVSVFLSGICYELFDLFLYDDIVENCDITLFFVSKDSLDYCKKKIDEIKNKNSHRYINVKFEYLSFYNLISKDFILKNQDIVYSTGILEYFEDMCFSIFINKLFDGLNESGDLFIGQYSENYGYKVYLEMGLEWIINYRDFEDLQKILNFIPEKDKFLYSSYKLGNLKFINAKKHEENK
jgi:hypothetical protein